MCAKSVAVPKKALPLSYCVCVYTCRWWEKLERCRRRWQRSVGAILVDEKRGWQTIGLSSSSSSRFQAPNSSLAVSSQKKFSSELRALERAGQEWRTFGDSISFPTHNSFFLFDRPRFSHRTSGVEDGGRRSQREKEEEGEKKRILLCSRIERESPLFPPPPFPDPIPPPPPSLLPQLLSARILRPDD